MFVLLIIIGLITGVLAGLLGVGGGVITVPAMYYLFQFYEFPAPFLMHTCIATALAATTITSSGSSWSHYKKKAIDFSVLKQIVPGLIVGCLAGAFLSRYLSSRALEILFGGMSILFSVYFFAPKRPDLYIAPHPNRSLLLFGLMIGALSSLLGVGGGIFMVPLLLAYQVPLPRTVASSSAGTLATAFVGSLAYLYLAKEPTGIPFTLGYIQIPAFLLIGLGSLATTSLGCKLAHSLHPGLIKKIFATALCTTGLAMILGK